MKTVIVILAIGSMFQGCYLAVVNYVFFSGRTGLLSGITISCGFAYLGGGWFLCGRYGVMAFAGWYAAVQFFLFVAVWILAARVQSVPWGSLHTVIRLIAGTGTRLLNRSKSSIELS